MRDYWTKHNRMIPFLPIFLVGNDSNDRGCRTKLCAQPVGDIEKLFTEWDHFGWHRVTFYGNLKEAVYAIVQPLGMNVVEEA